jgi:Zn-dependent protease with chaperone function
MLQRGRFQSAVRLRVRSLLRDHPATDERIQALLAMPQPSNAEIPGEEPLELA